MCRCAQKFMPPTSTPWTPPPGPGVGQFKKVMLGIERNCHIHIKSHVSNAHNNWVEGKHQNSFLL